MPRLSEHIDLPAPPETAYAVVSDLGLVFRLSPFWTLKGMKNGTDGKYEAILEQYESKQTATLFLTTTAASQNAGVSYTVENGPFNEMAFHMEKSAAGIRLTLQLSIESSDGSARNGTQREIAFWLRSIGEYIKLAAGTSVRKRAAKWFMDRVWLKLTLSERNIAIIITKITILELALLLVLVVLWRIFIP